VDAKGFFFEQGYYIAFHDRTTNETAWILYTKSAAKRKKLVRELNQKIEARLTEKEKELAELLR